MFFTDGCAVEDFNWPDRLILGSTSSEAVQMLKQIFHPLVMRGVPVIVTNQATAELVREAATAFVATKISFINEVAALCERVNADAVNLALALGLDKKIAPALPAARRRHGRRICRVGHGFSRPTGAGAWRALESLERCPRCESLPRRSPGRQNRAWR